MLVSRCRYLILGILLFFLMLLALLFTGCSGELSVNITSESDSEPAPSQTPDSESDSYQSSESRFWVETVGSAKTAESSEIATSQPGEQTTSKPSGETTSRPAEPAVSEPVGRYIGHTVAGREDCLACHGVFVMWPVPVGHQGRANETCLSCHQPLPEGPPRLAHSVEELTQCSRCHSSSAAMVMPSRHDDRADKPR